MSLLNEFPHRCTIRGTRYDVGEYGASEPTKFVRNTDVECWVQNASTAETVRFDRRLDAVTHRVYFNADPGLLVGDEIYITSGPSHVTETLTHRAYADRSAGLGLLWTSQCELETDEYQNAYE